MGIAGLWTSNRKATGEEVLSFTMLTLNADDHGLFRDFHKSTQEKRMVVILPPDEYDAWLNAPVALAMDFIRQYPASYWRQLLSLDVESETPEADGDAKKLVF